MVIGYAELLTPCRLPLQIHQSSVVVRRIGWHARYDTSTLVHNRSNAQPMRYHMQLVQRAQIVVMMCVTAQTLSILIVVSGRTYTRS